MDMNIHDITGNTALCAQIYIQFATEEHKDHLRYSTFHKPPQQCNVMDSTDQGLTVRLAL